MYLNGFGLLCLILGALPRVIQYIARYGDKRKKIEGGKLRPRSYVQKYIRVSRYLIHVTRAVDYSYLVVLTAEKLDLHYSASQ